MAFLSQRCPPGMCDCSFTCHDNPLNVLRGHGASHPFLVARRRYYQWGKYYGKSGYMRVCSHSQQRSTPHFVLAPSPNQLHQPGNSRVEFCNDQAVQSKWWDTTDLADLAGRVHLVTGANAGIGLEVAKELARRKGEVHMLCRNKERGEKARIEVTEETGNKNVFLHVVDVSSTASVRAFARQFLSRPQAKVDVLVNNAGVLNTERLKSEEGIEHCFATAMGGTILLTGLLWPALKRAAPSVVINVSSAGMFNAWATPKDLEYGKEPYDGVLQYAKVKRAQSEITEMWAQKTVGSGVSVQCMHPGYAATPGTEKLPGLVDKKEGSFFEEHGPKLRTAAQGADTIVWMASAPKVRETSGLFWADRRAVNPHFTLGGTKISKKDKDLLWEECFRIMGAKWKGDGEVE